MKPHLVGVGNSVVVNLLLAGILIPNSSVTFIAATDCLSKITMKIDNNKKMLAKKDRALLMLDVLLIADIFQHIYH